MDFLSKRIDHMPRRCSLFPRVEQVFRRARNAGSAFFNGPGFILCSGRGENIELYGRNWEVKNAGILPLCDKLSAGISWTGESPVSSVVSVTFSTSHASGNSAALPDVFDLRKESVPADGPRIYPFLPEAVFPALTMVDILIRFADDISGNLGEDPDGGRVLYADIADIAAYEIVWLFDYAEEKIPDSGRKTASEYTGHESYTGPIRAIRDYILSNREREIDYKDLAEKKGLSFTTFRRHWNRIIGQPPNEFLSRIRMEKARFLLSSTSKTIGEIARESGFRDQLYFSRRFHHYHGISPRSFRQDSTGV